MRINKTISVIDSLPLKNNSHILDLGSFNEKRFLNLINKIPFGKITTVDSDDEKINTILNIISNLKRNNINTEFTAVKHAIDHGNSIPFRDDFCDVIILSHNLRNVIYRESLLKECLRVLIPGGMILVIESNFDSFNTSVHPDAKIRIDEMLEYLDNSGFTIAENFDTVTDEYGIIGISPLHNN